jgi:hypothetical protein
VTTADDIVRFELRLESREQFAKEYASDFERGRAFVPGAANVELRCACTLTLHHPTASASLDIAAETVWSDPNGAGVGLVFIDWTQERRSELEAFVERDSRPRQPNLYDRIRRMSVHEQQTLARNGGHAERVALERCVGGAVWEPLLQNPQLTGPEVASIAKKGGLPRPVLTGIAANAAWLAVPEVQRALLSNPRLEPNAVSRVLRAMPRADLARVAAQLRYSPRIRGEAKRILGVTER